MKITINTVMGNVLFEGDAHSLADAVVSALKIHGTLCAINLRGADLYSAALRGADLRGANLRDANLRGADLSRANLSGADLSGADLNGATMRRADLSGALMRGETLSGAILSGADLSGATLSDALLRRADLRRTNLYSADLRGADLSGADTFGADLEGAFLGSARGGALLLAQTRILPAEGSLIGWKKCADGVIVKLRIPENARRSHAFGRKCRAEFAEVLEVYGAAEGVSVYDGETVYRVGETVFAHAFGARWQDECAPGIHFFITREEAEAYEI